MTAKPSKSEIENALTGQQRRSPLGGRRSNNVERQLDSMTARRQQVIGGDLTGVSRKQSAGLRQWLSEINIINWVASAIVLLIVAVFFWPSGSEDKIREISSTVKSDPTGTFYDEARIDQPTSQIGEQSFIRETDIPRASDFRAIDENEREIKRLLSKAESHIAKGEYTQPSEQNAVESYKKVLLLQPTNPKAKQGLDYVNGRYLNLGYQALEQNNLARATTSLQKLAIINSESDEYVELEDAISIWREKRQIDKFLVSASQAFKDDKMILPARQNALFYYQQILEIEPNNEIALGGINRIVNNFVNKANSAINANQLEAASGYLATIGVIDAKHPSIDGISNRIRNAQNTARSTEPEVARQQPQSRSTQPTPAPSTSAQRQPTNVRTPAAQTSEQETFDRQYLQRGLAAYYKGEYDDAAALLQPLADKGVSRAQFRIAYMHFLGRGFDKNKDEADRIIRAALPAIQKFADEGRGWAQSDIGSLYEDGLVLPRDYGEAIYWYRSAAEQGYPGAQTNLGIMYARGLGVSTSRKTAIEWFQRAAKQGDIAARRNLQALGIKP